MNLAESLRHLADRIEANVSCDIADRCNIDLYFHNLTTLEELRQTRLITEKVTADHNGGTYWFGGKFGTQISVKSFYPAGLLGGTQECREEIGTDLSLLD